MRIGFALVVLTLIFNQCESILVKRYGKKYNNGGLFFNAVICFLQ